MDTLAAYAVYPNDVEVAEVVRVLNQLGFGNERICLMFAPTHPVAIKLRHANMLGGEHEASVAIAGSIGWLCEFGAVVIPTVGFLIHSPAFLLPLLAARNTLAQCGSARTLAGLGFSDWKAERLQVHLQQAGYLVYVASVETSSISHVLEVFPITGAEESARLDREARAEATD